MTQTQAILFLILLTLILVVVCAISYQILVLPIKIAKKKNLASKEMITIKALVWSALIVGVTWPVALILAFYYKEQPKIYRKHRYERH